MSHTPSSEPRPLRPRLRELIEGGPRRLLFVWTVLLVMGTLVYFFAVPEMRAYYHSWRAERALAAYDDALARRHFEQCLKIWKDSPQLHFRAARACWRDGDFESANRHLSRAVRLGWPRDAAELEYAFIQAQDLLTWDLEISLRKSLQQLDQLDDRDTNVAAREALAHGYLKLFRLADAEAMTQAAVALDEANWRLWSLLGVVLVEAKNPTKAIEALERSARLRPDQPMVHYWLAAAQVALGNGAQALAHLEKVRRDDAKLWEIDQLTARAYYLQRRWAEARGASEAALQRGGDQEGPVLAWRGLIALEEDGPAAATTWLERAESLAPNHPEVLDALEEWAKRQSEAGRLADAQNRRARYRQAVGRLAELHRHLNDLLQQSNADPPRRRNLLYDMGQTLFQIGQDQAAARTLTMVTRDFVDFRPAHEALEQYYRRIGDPFNAASHAAAAKKAKKS
ncbi:MAG: tetratricopeptide repeat protein [Gemmataceae bacterium]|nr:tetratricopeptide repeat protein [Gemmataceae bacterium]